MGGLGRSHPSGVLMARIRRLFGYVDLPTLMASADRDERSRSPAHRIPSTQMIEKGSGKGSLGDVMSGPQQLHAGAASLGAAEDTQTGLTKAERDFGLEHFKGSGKGSLGDTIPVPQPLHDSIGSEGAAEHTRKAGKQMSPQEIDAWIQENYKELENPWQGNVTQLSSGMNCLWKGIKKGKNSGESTKYEYFNGIFHGWDDDEFVIVS